MPLTPFQAEILRLLSRNRSSGSYVAGGIPLNANEPERWSADGKVFHEAADAVIRARSVRGALCALIFACLLPGCVSSSHDHGETNGAGGPSTASLMSAGWGIDACLTAFVPKEGRGAYLQLLQGSGVKWLRERGPDSGMAEIKGAGFHVVSFLGDLHAGQPRVADVLPEDLLAVFNGAKALAQSSEARTVDAWEMVGEPDVGYCTDLPDRVAAFQKAVYLGIKAGAAEVARQKTDDRGQDERDGGRLLEPSTFNPQLSTRPAPLVLMGALALPPGPWLERAQRNGLLDYTDAYNFHFYGHAADLAGVIAAHSRVARVLRDSSSQRAEGRSADAPSSVAGSPSSNLRPATVLRSLSSGFHRLISVVRPRPSGLPLWITECGINAVPVDDLAEPSRRKLQAEFTIETARQALAAKQVAMFMPFILVHQGDPHALTSSAEQPYPAWNAYAEFTRAHPWPDRALAAPPVAPNPVVMQWMPNNATAQGHKVSGSYRFLGSKAIEGELRIYNFSDHPIHGHLRAGILRRLRHDISVPDSIELAPMSLRAIPLAFRRESSVGYVHENWSVAFVDQAGRRSSVAFALETTPEDEVADFVEVPLALESVGTAGSRHKFDRGDEIATRGTVWQSVNGLRLREDRESEAPALLEVWTTEKRRDPTKANLAVARLPGGLPATGFLRVRLDRPMDRDFKMCVDLVDRLGQRFSIWENFGVSYFRPQSTDVWLNLADFAPYFWGRCSADPRLHPANIEEIQLRFYISKPSDPRKVSLSFMKQREAS